MPLQRNQQSHKQDRDPHRREQRPQDIGLIANQILIDEYPGKRWIYDIWDDDEQPTVSAWELGDQFESCPTGRVFFVNAFQAVNCGRHEQSYSH